MEGLSVFQAGEWLATLPELFIQLHVGDPGPNGVVNVAKETRRRPVSLKLLTVDGRSVSVEDVFWVNVKGPATPTHFTAWDGQGRFRFSGLIGPEGYQSGDKFTVPAGGLSVMLTLAR